MRSKVSIAYSYAKYNVMTLIDALNNASIIALIVFEPSNIVHCSMQIKTCTHNNYYTYYKNYLLYL